MVYQHSADRVLLTKGGVTVFDTNLKTFGLVDAAKISLTGQTVTFPDLNKSNAYYWAGSAGSPFNTETAVGYITALPQEWGPTAANVLSDTLLGTVPAGTDYLDVRASITRTSAPDAILGDTLPMVVPSGKSIRLLGGSCLLEEGPGFCRGFAIVLDGTNVYLRRYQSVSADTILGWSATNDSTQSGVYTWDAAGKGIPFHLIGYVINASTSVLGSWRRGSSNQLSSIPFADTTNYGATYSMDLDITPGFFNTDATVHAPAGKAAVRLAPLYSVFSPAGSASFASVPFGVPDASRRILVSLGSHGGGASVSAVSIGGVSATKLVGNSGSVGDASIWMASVPTGTSGDIIVTYSGTTARAVAGVAYAFYNLASGTAVDTKNTSTSGSALSLTTAGTGFAIAAGYHQYGGSGSDLSGIAPIGFAQTYTGVVPVIDHFVGVQPTDGTTLSIALTTSGGGLNLACASLS